MSHTNTDMGIGARTEADAESTSATDAAGMRDEIRRCLAAAPIAEAWRTRDPRAVYRDLGARGLLAPQWPQRYGGRGAGHVAAAVLVEELLAHDVPDLLHTLTVQIVGMMLLDHGDDAQRSRFLPAFAAGQRTACVLFSEPDAGSDLSALVTSATPVDGGFELRGRKIYSPFASTADVGLCLARTGGNGVEGLTLFLVPLDAPGVTVERVPALMDDVFHQLHFDGVRLDETTVVGGVGRGWSLLVATLVYERTGLDYYAKALRWVRALDAHVDASGDHARHDVVERGRLEARLAAAASYVRRVLTRLDDGTLSEDAAAASKWYTSELAARVAWAGHAAGAGCRTIDPGRDASYVLDSAYREAPGLRISGGTSEMMLETIARLRIDAGQKARR